MDETKSSILSDSDLSTFPLMRMRKKSCKSFRGGFSVVRLEKINFFQKLNSQNSFYASNIT